MNHCCCFLPLLIFWQFYCVLRSQLKDKLSIKPIKMKPTAMKSRRELSRTESSFCATPALIAHFLSWPRTSENSPSLWPPSPEITVTGSPPAFPRILTLFLPTMFAPPSVLNRASLGPALWQICPALEFVLSLWATLFLSLPCRLCLYNCRSAPRGLWGAFTGSLWLE